MAIWPAVGISLLFASEVSRWCDSIRLRVWSYLGRITFHDAGSGLDVLCRRQHSKQRSCMLALQDRLEPYVDAAKRIYKDLVRCALFVLAEWR